MYTLWFINDCSGIAFSAFTIQIEGWTDKLTHGHDDFMNCLPAARALMSRLCGQKETRKVFLRKTTTKREGVVQKI